MTSRERVECAIRFEKPDRVPFNFWMDRRRMAELETKYGPEFRLKHFGADLIENFECFPPFPAAEYETQSGTSWMVRELFEDWEDTKAIVLPDPKAPALYEALHYRLKQYADRAIIVNSPGPLTIIEMMKRQENLYTDMLMCPEEVKAFFDRISDVMAMVAEQVCKEDITALYVQDDVAYNNGLLLSEKQLREFVLPSWKKVIDVGHAHEKPVFFHTDGKVDSIWPLFADELGVRMLNPLQPELQDLREFKRLYHGKMGCYGGLPTGRLHLMTPEEIQHMVIALFNDVGADGGLIISSHDIDYAMSETQLDALASAVRECTY